MLNKVTHTHTLRRKVYKSTGNSVFFCIDGICHYKVDCSLALGKLTICNRCGSEFKLEALHLRQAKPHCRACNKTKVVDSEGHKHFIRMDEVAKEIGEGVVTSLKDRLDKVVKTAEDAVEDI